MPNQDSIRLDGLISEIHPLKSAPREMDYMSRRQALAAIIGGITASPLLAVQAEKPAERLITPDNLSFTNLPKGPPAAAKQLYRRDCKNVSPDLGNHVPFFRWLPIEWHEAKPGDQLIVLGIEEDNLWMLELWEVGREGWGMSNGVDCLHVTRTFPIVQEYFWRDGGPHSTGEETRALIAESKWRFGLPSPTQRYMYQPDNKGFIDQRCYTLRDGVWQERRFYNVKTGELAVLLSRSKGGIVHLEALQINDISTWKGSFGNSFNISSDAFAWVCHCAQDNVTGMLNTIPPKEDG